MTNSTASLSQLTRASNWRAALRVLLGLLILYTAVWIIRVIMEVGPNLLMRWFGAGPDFRAYIGSTLNYGFGIASYIMLPAIALRRILVVNPWPILFPFHNG